MVASALDIALIDILWPRLLVTYARPIDSDFEFRCISLVMIYHALIPFSIFTAGTSERY